MAADNPSHLSTAPLASSSEKIASVPWDRFERFMGQFTHDVRNGLNALELQLTFLGEISTDPEAVEEVKHLRGTLADLTRQLQTMKTAIGAVYPNILPYPANDLFEDLRERLTKLLPGTVEKVTWQLADDPAVSLLVDPDLTINGLLELFANTVRFSGTSVRCITMNGAGATSFILEEAPTDAPTIPVAQWGREPLLTSRRGAYGLGLFRVCRIVEAQGGKIRADYAADKNLLTTTVTLPRANESGSR